MGKDSTTASNGLDYVYKFNPYGKKHNNYRNKKRKFEDIIRKYEHRLDDSDSSDDGYGSDNDGFDEDVSSRDNKIYFKTAISEDSVDKLIKIIESKNRKFKRVVNNNKLIKTAEPHPLYLHITSYGGDLLASFRAVDAIKRSEIPIYTVVDGYAASGATLMSVVGSKRFMTPNSYMLIHQLSSGAMGKFWEIKDDFDNCETWMNDIYNLYEEHTNMDMDELKEYLSHDLWWKLQMALDKGLVDEVYDQDHLV